MTPSKTEILPLELDTDGVWRVGGTRVTLDAIVEAFTQGATAEEIAQQYPALKLSEVYFVIGYYLRNQIEVQNYLLGRKQRREEVRKQNESRFDPQGIRDRLVTRRTGQDR